MHVLDENSEKHCSGSGSKQLAWVKGDIKR